MPGSTTSEYLPEYAWVSQGILNIFNSSLDTSVLCFIQTSSPYPGYKMLSRLLLAHLCIYAATIVMHTSRMWCTGLMGIHAQFSMYLMSYCILNILTASLETYMIRYIWTSSPYLDCDMSSRQLPAHLCIYAATVMMHSSRVGCTGLMGI